MIWPSFLARSFSTAFRRSSNSPRNFAPAIKRAHVQREHTLAAQAFRHFAVDDALRQTFDDGGLADAGLADQHRIVLGATLQHLDGAADFLVAADHRIELARFGARGQIDGVFLQRLTLILGVLALHLLAAAHRVDRRFEFLLVRAAAFSARPGVAACRPARPARTVRWR
jgi:hypothetical protein